ncbi:glycosyltransferase [Priestia megaterium]|nr:glycosyltransferase [Priestia megaterium]
MQNKRKVLILTASYGNGHVQVAKVLKQSFLKSGAAVKVSSLYTESYPKMAPISESIYLKSYTSIGQPIYSFCYHGIERIYDKKVAKWFVRLGMKRLQALIKEEQPDLIVQTFPVLATSVLRRQNHLNIPIVNVVTDYTLHKIWYQPEIDKYYISSDNVASSLKKLNVPASSMLLSGIPIRNHFETASNTEDLYNKYQLQADKPVILVMAGAFGVLRNLRSLCNSLLNSFNIQLVVICGKNNRSKLELQEMEKKFNNRLKLFGYVEQIHELFQLSSFMITKSGGVTLSEAAASGLPVILYQPVPGQEKANAKFFDEQGAGVVAHTNLDAKLITRHLLSHPYSLQQMRMNMHRLHRLDAATAIVNDCLKLIDDQHEYLKHSVRRNEALIH